MEGIGRKMEGIGSKLFCFIVVRALKKVRWKAMRDCLWSGQIMGIGRDKEKVKQSSM